jgi:ABC-type polysaccharide/polyol phosphate transport system ATPase subunit
LALQTLPNGTVSVDGVWKRFHADTRDTQLTSEISRIIRSRRGESDGWRWALRDINVHIEPGEAVALIGHNGSGKTTLLKMMSRVMYPHSGDVHVAGRIGALIDVTGGIHPELSGRENIILYGSLLGLPRKQMAARLDEIVAFAELEEAIDRQVKFYSWGMQMRLGFSVAAFLEPDLLLVDEVLAVGDSRFQQRCLSRMRAVLEMGTTLIFVSHDLAAIEAMCTRGVLLDHGVVKSDAPLREAMTMYRSDIEQASADEHTGTTTVRLVSAGLQCVGGGPVSAGEPTLVTIELEADEAEQGELYLGMSEGPSTPVVLVRTPVTLKSGRSIVQCNLDTLPLPQGEYALWLSVVDRKGSDVLSWRSAGQFHIEGETMPPTPVGIMRLAPVYVRADWDVASA